MAKQLIKPKKVAYMLHLPEALRDEFKAVCAANGDAMRAVLVNAIRAYIRRHPKQSGQPADQE